MPVQHTAQRKLAYLFLLLAVAFWGLATPVVKATVSYVPPLSFLMIRFWIASIFTIPLSIYFLKHYKIDRVRLKHIFVSAFIGYILAMSLFFIGLEKTSAVEGSLITSFSPLLVSIMGFLILKEVITKKEIEGTLLAFVGALVIIFEPLIISKHIFNGGTNSFTGNVLFFLAVIFDGLYIIYIKKYLSKDKLVTPLMYVTFSFVIAAIAFTLLGFTEQYTIYRQSEQFNTRGCTVADVDKSRYDAGLVCDSRGCSGVVENYTCLFKSEKTGFIGSMTANVKNYVSRPAIYGILYMAIISGIFGYILFQQGLKYIEASEATLFYYLQPLFGIPIAMLFLQETVSYIFIIGAGIIIVGIYMAEKR